jgi:hypothetical protein
MDRELHIHVRLNGRAFIYGSRGSSASIVTRLRAGQWGFDSWQGQRSFLFATASRPILGPTQPPMQWISGPVSPGIKRSGRGAEHLSPCSADIENAWSYTSTLLYIFMT